MEADTRPVPPTPRAVLSARAATEAVREPRVTFGFATLTRLARLSAFSRPRVAPAPATGPGTTTDL